MSLTLLIKKTLTDWLSLIDSFHPKEIDLGLARVSVIAESLGLSKFLCPVITVAGTNGKGSVVKFLESIYCSAGYRVGAYTSPHLLRFNERLRINQVDIPDEDLLVAFEVIESHRGKTLLTFFEFTTLAILYICQQKCLDVLVLEVGLGGRLDAVNAIYSDISVITTIDLDHTEWLGPDRESIGREKVGITAPGRPLVCGDDNPPESVILGAKKNNAPAYYIGQDFHWQMNEALGWDWRGLTMSYHHLPITKLKIENASVSLMVIELLQHRLPVTQFAVIEGLKKAVLPGRFEFVELGVPIILDVAHNPQSTSNLALQLQQLPNVGKTKAVVGMLKDKDIKNTLKPLLGIVDEWYLADLDDVTPRGATATHLANFLTTENKKNWYNCRSVADALKTAINGGPCDRIVVFGSFYTVALAKTYLMRLAEEKSDGK